MMFADGHATDSVPGCGSALFERHVRNHTIISMSTVGPCYSEALSREIVNASGCYVEAAVPGSRVPADRDELIAMLSGDPDSPRLAADVLDPVDAQHVQCGAVPSALRMKLAVNAYLITMVTGLYEAASFAAQPRHGEFAAILEAGPMCSQVSRIKLEKLCSNNLTRQARITDVLKTVV